MAAKEQVLVEWLRDAYAMEREAATLLENQIRRLNHYPEMQAKLQAHLGETRQQIKVLTECLRRYDTEPPRLKDLATRFMANIQSLATHAADDEVVKYALADYSFECFEVASYRCNIAAAEEVGDQQTKADLERILAEEERMVAWLAEHIPSIGRHYMTRQLTEPAAAKR